MKTNTLLFLSLSLPIFSFAQGTTIQWQHSFGGSSYDYTREVENTLDGGYVFIGYSESCDGDISVNHGGGDCWVIKYEASGCIQWKKAFGGSGYDYGSSIYQTSDGGYIIGGYTESNNGDVSMNHGSGDCWIIKLSDIGNIQWQKTFGGTATDNAQCIKQTTDGGFIISGYTESNNGDVSGNHGGGDCWVLKLDNSGNIVWQKAIGGSSYDFAQSIKQTSDNGFILSGGTNSNNGDVSEEKGNGDSWIVKLDCSGGILWEKSFGGSNYDFAQSVEQTSDEGFIVIGYTESTNGDVFNAHGGGDCWVFKCDNSGSLLWEKTLGSSGNDYGYCIKQLLDGGYVLTGYSEINDGDVSENHGNYDCWVVNLNESGLMIWQKSIGGSGADIGYSINEIGTNNFVVAGYSESSDGDVVGNHGGGDSWIFKFSSDATSVEENYFGNSILVSRNPNSESFNFNGISEGSKIEIYDISGKIIFQSIAPNNFLKVDLKNQANGIYVYRVIDKNDKIQTSKIVL